MLPSSGRCPVHHERPGVGVCIECRRVVCAECTTRFEGINRCTGCLARHREEAERVRPSPEWSAVNVVVAILGVVVLLLTTGAMGLLLER